MGIKHLLFFLIGTAVGSLSALWISNYVIKENLRTLSVRQLTIVDSGGRPRAVLGVDSADRVSLGFMTPDNHRELSIGVEKNRALDPAVSLPSRNEFEVWAPSVELYDKSGRTSSLLTTSLYGNSVLSFYGTDSLWHLGVGYIDDGSDITGGPWAWGIRANKGFAETSLGVFDQPPLDQKEYLTPSINARMLGDHRRSVP